MERGEGKRPGSLFIQSVEKAFCVLGAFNVERATLSLTEMVEVTGIDKSAIQRYLGTLVELGYIEKDGTSKRYSLTHKNLEVGFQFTQTNPLVKSTSPYIIDLWRTTNEAVSLSVLEDINVVYVARLLSPHSLTNRFGPGPKAPAYCVAAGLAMLSRLPEDRVLSLLQASDLRKFTSNTEIRIPQIIARLKVAREVGYVICSGEFFPNDITIAAPIVDSSGMPLGAINIATTKDRHTPQSVEEQFSNLLMNVVTTCSSPIRPRT